jgi:hypothetical protein
MSRFSASGGTALNRNSGPASARNRRSVEEVAALDGDFSFFSHSYRVSGHLARSSCGCESHRTDTSLNLRKGPLFAGGPLFYLLVGGGSSMSPPETPMGILPRSRRIPTVYQCGLRPGALQGKSGGGTVRTYLKAEGSKVSQWRGSDRLRVAFDEAICSGDQREVRHVEKEAVLDESHDTVENGGQAGRVVDHDAGTIEEAIALVRDVGGTGGVPAQIDLKPEILKSALDQRLGHWDHFDG